jgi:hypothetical protein
VHRLSAAIATLINRMPGPICPARAREIRGDSIAHDLAIEEVWLRRWIIGHQVHAMLNVYASWAVAEAIDAIRAKDLHRALTALDDARHIVEGFSAARAHALALPPDFYQDVLRPTMNPPLTSMPLSGRMHVEYRIYRHRINELLDVLPMQGTRAAAIQPALSLHGERLLEADLIEAERHITLVEPLVGNSKSLIQTPKSADNAVSALRTIRHRRATRIANYVRFPDQAFKASPQTRHEDACPNEVVSSPGKGDEDHDDERDSSIRPEG